MILCTFRASHRCWRFILHFLKQLLRRQSQLNLRDYSGAFDRHTVQESRLRWDRLSFTSCHLSPSAGQISKLKLNFILHSCFQLRTSLHFFNVVFSSLNISWHFSYVWVEKETFLGLRGEILPQNPSVTEQKQRSCKTAFLFICLQMKHRRGQTDKQLMCQW